MGPVFTIVFLLIIAMIGTAVCFGITKLFLPLRDALILAPLLMAAGGVGCIAGLLLQIPFTPEGLNNAGQVMRYLGVGLATGVLSAGTALWLFLRWRLRRKPRMTSAQMSTFD